MSDLYWLIVSAVFTAIMFSKAATAAGDALYDFIRQKIERKFSHERV